VTRYWCELAWLGGDQPTAAVAITVEDGRIAQVEAASLPVAADVRLRGLTLPGLANGHSHAFHRLLRGRTHRPTVDGSFWTWRDQMYALAAQLTPDSYHRLARGVFAEMVTAGFTSVGEFHYLHHGPDGVRYHDPNEMGLALIAAASEAGIRITLLDTCYLHGGVGEPVSGVQRRFSDGSAQQWADRVMSLSAAESDRARIGAAVHSVRAVEPTEIEIVNAIAREHGMPLHAHVSEQPAENAACLAAYGRTPTAVLADAGALDGRFTAVHATHLTDDDVVALGAAGCCVCMCPTTERDLADGVGPVAGLVAAGASLSIGSDSHAVIDPFDEARGIELHQRLVTGRRGHHLAAELMAAASVDGHRSIGWDDIGLVSVGMRADLVSVSLDAIRMAGAGVADALDMVVFAASAADVHHVVVDGRVVVRDGRHVTIDAAAEIAAAVTAP
jgi:formiminoglutamate deiminase